MDSFLSGLAVVFFAEDLAASAEGIPHHVVLMDVDSHGRPVPDGKRFFILTTTPTRSEAEAYAKRLSFILGLEVLELA